MMTVDPFEARLAAAMATYASEADVDQDPFAIAREITGRYRRSRAFAPLGMGPSWRTAIVVGLIVSLALLGAIVAGSMLMRPTEPSPSPSLAAPAVPDALLGRWRAGNPRQTIDLSGVYLVWTGTEDVASAPSEPEELYGRVVEFHPSASDALEGELVIQAAGECGEGRYMLRVNRGNTSIRFETLDDPCAARSALLAGQWPWFRDPVLLLPNTVQDSLDFSEPLQFTITTNPAIVGGLYQTFSPHRLDIVHAFWNAAFVDDVPVNRDLCDRSKGTLPDIPSSVDEVGAWLAMTTAVRIEGQTDVAIDGRRALRWDLASECATTGPEVAEGAGGYVIYAIPTRADVIIFTVRADTSTEAAIADRLVRGIHFR